MTEAIDTYSAPADAWSVPLDAIDVSDSTLFERNAHWPYFERLRKEDPVHYTADSAFGAYWSVTRFNDIKYVDTHHELFSSVPTIVIGDPAEDFTLPMFIAMDPPRHDEQRKGVVGAVSPKNLALLESTIRAARGDDSRFAAGGGGVRLGRSRLHRVDHADARDAVRLSVRRAAQAHPLVRLRHVVAGTDRIATSMTEEQRRAELMECLAYFNRLWEERKRNPGNDFVSMMAHSPAFQKMEPLEYLGNLVLLIVGGNDTTRNSISGGVYALNRFADQYDKLRANPQLIPNMVSEIIRWQTPLAHMRRTALVDTELAGKQIRAGDRVVMWYVSGNRDEDIFDDADKLIIDRHNARQHVSFGFGVHRCMGNRLAEMQLRILWEEILKRFHHVEVTGEPERVCSNFVKGYASMPVRLHAA
jgi:cytochrome P450